MPTIGIDLYANDPLPEPPPALRKFQLSMPAWDDVIHVVPESYYPEEERRRRARQRAIRLATSPVPAVVQRVTQIMGVVDDVEDMLSTALVLGRPILSRLGPKVTPILGWVLTGRDIAEFALAVTSVMRAGRDAKRKGIELLESVSLKSGARVRKATRFLSHRPGLGAVVEGLQSLDVLTGVGLSIGPAYGASSEAFWTIVRTSQGRRVKVRLPDPTTPSGAASYVLTGAPILLLFLPLLDVAVIFALLVALWLSIGYFVGHVEPEALTFQLGDVSRSRPVQRLPRRRMTREVLSEIGIDPDRDEPPLVGTSTDPGTYLDEEDAVRENWRGISYAAKLALGKTYIGTLSAQLVIDATKTWFAWLESEPGNVRFSPNMADLILMRMIEHGTIIQRRRFGAPLA